ncbi:hypothetical protein PTKIN_Ptkin12aG0015300 [Pterospermum kingtungense]
MDDFGAEKQAVAGAEASDHKPKQEQSTDDESENQQDNEAEASNTRKRGRKQTLTLEERHERKKQRDRDYRKGLKEERRVLKEQIEALQKEKKENHSEINSLKEELLKIIARADESVKELSDVSKKLKEVIMAKERLESEMQQLQEKILNQEHLENCDFNDIPMDYDYLYGFSMGDNTLNNFSHRQHPEPSKGKGAEVVNVEGFTVLKENAIVIQDILSQYPKIASALKIHHPESINGLMNTLAEVYKIAREEKHTLEEIKRMEKGIQDLEFAGFKVSWLKTMVAKAKRMQRKA